MPPAGKRPPTVGAAPRQTAAAAAWRQAALLLHCQLVSGPLPTAAARAAAPAAARAAATAAARPCCNTTEKETFQRHDCTSLPLPQASVTGHGSMGHTGIDPAYKRCCVYQVKTCQRHVRGSASWSTAGGARRRCCRSCCGGCHVPRAARCVAAAAAAGWPAAAAGAPWPPSPSGAAARQQAGSGQERFEHHRWRGTRSNLSSRESPRRASRTFAGQLVQSRSSTTVQPFPFCHTP